MATKNLLSDLVYSPLILPYINSVLQSMWLLLIDCRVLLQNWKIFTCSYTLIASYSFDWAPNAQVVQKMCLMPNLCCSFFGWQVLLQPFHYVLQVPGKMIREQLAQAFNYWMKIPKDKLDAISEVVLVLHNASLLWVSTDCLWAGW